MVLIIYLKMFLFPSTVKQLFFLKKLDKSSILKVLKH